MQWPLFLPVGATKARLGTCQGEVRVCSQALLGRGRSHGAENKSGGSLAQLGKHKRWDTTCSPPWLGQGAGSMESDPTTHLSICPPDVLRFDNTYSFVHAKKVSFTVEVLLPDEGMQKYDKELTPV